uniref:cytoplasmic dynein 1 light intermediate chain 2-like n=1 Tax=Myxine glutinosa TaxID=7769 RepID=UPI00358E531B
MAHFAGPGAAYGVSPGRAGGVQHSESGEGKGRSERIWQSLLFEASLRGRPELPLGRRVVILGDQDSGKESLAAALCGVPGGLMMKSRNGLNYLYFSKRDIYTEELEYCSVWILSGDRQDKRFLHLALPADAVYPGTEYRNGEPFRGWSAAVILVVDLARPWAACASLKRWATVLEQHLDGLGLSEDALKVAQWKLTCDIGDFVKGDDYTPVASEFPHRNEQSESPQHQVAGLTVKKNLGLPIVVVGSKCDKLLGFVKEHGLSEEHMDFIQIHLRRICLSYGAAMTYLCVQEQNSVQQLRSYLEWRLCRRWGAAQVSYQEYPFIFIPAGWDSERKIAILSKSLMHLDPHTPYEDIIVEPTSEKPTKEEEILVKDHEDFLQELQLVLSKPPLSPLLSKKDTPIKSPRKFNLPRSPRTPVRGPKPQIIVTPHSTPRRGLNVGGSGDDKQQLILFFNTLIDRKNLSANTTSQGSAACSLTVPRTPQHSEDDLREEVVDHPPHCSH